MKNIKGIIFDLDGTLFDSCYVWHLIDLKFFKKRNLEMPEDYSKKIATLGLVKAAEYSKATFNLKESIEEIISEWKSMAIYEYTNNIKLKENVIEYLEYCKQNNIKMAIATANDDTFYMPCLIRNNIKDYFTYICDVNQFKGSKNTPEIYLKAAKHLNLLPSEVAVFEDIPRALRSAKEGGFYTVAVDDIAEKDYVLEKKEISDLFITNFNELL